MYLRYIKVFNIKFVIFVYIVLVSAFFTTSCRPEPSTDFLEVPATASGQGYQAPTKTEFNPDLSPTPTTSTPNILRTSQEISSASEAIEVIKSNFQEVQEIEDADLSSIGISQDIYTKKIEKGWNIVFWQGSGDCASGCLNDHYWYFFIDKNGDISFTGEFDRAFDSFSGDYIITGEPLWGIPY